MMTDRRPHSRDCGITPHAHGPACHINCPSCAGGRMGDDDEVTAPAAMTDATDIVERLRVMSFYVCIEAANEIVRLRAALAAAGVREAPPTAAEADPWADLRGWAAPTVDPGLTGPRYRERVAALLAAYDDAVELAERWRDAHDAVVGAHDDVVADLARARAAAVGEGCDR